jgi:flagella basal body P-ring formation protein FlgA
MGRFLKPAAEPPAAGALSGLRALCEALPGTQRRNKGLKARHFHVCRCCGVPTLQAVIHPALLPLALALLLPAWRVDAHAQAPAPAAEASLEPSLAQRVRSLVAPAVPLPAPLAAQARVGVEVGKLDPRLRLAPCRRIEPQLPARGSLWGRTRIGLRCVEGERPWQVWLPVVVTVHAPALVPVRQLAAGTVLAAEHLQVAEVDWAAEPQAPLVRAEELIGRTLSRTLQPGQALRQGDLRQRQWFAAGDTVQVRARGDGFVVAGEAQALGHGLEGHPVRVRTESGRVLTAVPVADRQVEVQL